MNPTGKRPRPAGPAKPTGAAGKSFNPGPGPSTKQAVRPGPSTKQAVQPGPSSKPTAQDSQSITTMLDDVLSSGPPESPDNRPLSAIRSLTGSRSGRLEPISLPPSHSRSMESYLSGNRSTPLPSISPSSSPLRPSPSAKLPPLQTSASMSLPPSPATSLGAPAPLPPSKMLQPLGPTSPPPAVNVSPPPDAQEPSTSTAPPPEIKEPPPMKTPKVQGSQLPKDSKWRALAKEFNYQRPRSGTSDTSMISQDPQGQVEGDQPDDPENENFRKEIQALKFLVKLKAGEAKMRERKQEEDFIPQNRRRFLFDDKVIRLGASLSEVLKAQVHVDTDIPEEDFNDIVDQDDERVEAIVASQLVGDLIETIYFRMFIMVLIIINSIMIGMQTDERLATEYAVAFAVFDQAILATFTCELLLKWYYGFWIFWKVGWNILDFLIIVALLLGPQLAFLSSSRILRILRVLRALRSLRSVSALAGLSMVVQTILQSVPDMVNIVLLLFIILLVLAVSGVTLFGRRIPEHYGDLQTAMFSLFICVTQDGWVDIYNEFQSQGSTMHIGGAFFLFLCIMVGAFIFANLVVAVVVTNLEMAMREFAAESEAARDEMEMRQPIMAQVDKTISGADTETAPTKSFEEVKNSVDFTMRKPLQKGDLKGLTLTKMERYCLVIAAFEANLAEYELLKKDLAQMYALILDLNTTPMDEGEEEDKKVGGKDIVNEFEYLQRGDILSNLMRMEESQNISSDKAHDISSVIRTAGKSRRRQSLSTIRAQKAGKRRSIVDLLDQC